MKKDKKRKNVKKVNTRRTKKRIKIRYGRIFLSLLIVFLIIYLIFSVAKFPIKNIFVYNNQILSDQEIIDMAGISNYPSILSKTSREMEKKLEKNIYIKDAEVTKKRLKEIHIVIEENYCVFYDASKNVSILKNKEEVEGLLKCPTLINYVPDKIYNDFIDKMVKIDKNVIDRISEIKYDPNSVDEERFLFTMSDGNYVYLTLMYFDKINNYVDIIKNFKSQKGILYLDSGEYFKVFEQ